MIKTTNNRTTYHCDICDKPAGVSQVLGRDIDLCQWPCWPETSEMTVYELIEYIKESQNEGRDTESSNG